MKNIFKTHSKYFKVLGLGLLMMPSAVFAAGPPKVSELSNPLAVVLLVVIIGLLALIALLASIVIGAAKLNLQRFVDERKRNDSGGKILALAACVLVSSAVFAEGTAAAAAPTVVDTIAGLSTTTFYSLLTVVFLELLILYVLLFNLKLLLRKETIALKGVEETTETTPTAFNEWWEKFNSFKPMKEEASIDLGHDYDGIRELDNRLPPWWIYGFYLTIFVACIYLWRYHVSHSAPLSKEEYTISVQNAEIEKQEYLKHAANSVDENTVKLLTSADDLEAGKKVFTTICAACHRADGGGAAGPNLTDDYWLHGGTIKDVFKTIKYGWPEKGMKSWKDDYSPKQIQQIASYVRTLHGTTPAAPKPKQGELYQEAASPSAPAADTAKAAAAKK